MLHEKINKDLQEAMKSRDEIALSTLRMLNSAIMYHKLGKKEDRNDVGDQDVVEVAQKEVKKRQEALEMYKKGGRAELAEKEEKEIEVLMRYLPEQMSEEDVEKLVGNAIAQTSATSVTDMGKVMGVLMPKVKGKADGNLVSKIVREKLS